MTFSFNSTTTVMSSARNQPPSDFPPVPPSLSTGDYEMRDYNAPQDPPRPTPYNTATTITPYLGLRARLSQTWINRWTILLLLVLVRTLLAISGLNDDLDNAKREALSACSGVEAAGSAMASMPHYMSQGVNELTAQGVEKAVNGLMSMLTLSVTAVEEIVVFYINLLTSTYVCLITLAVSGSLHVALQVIEDATKFLNQTIGTIGQDIHDDSQSFMDDMNSFLKGLSGLPLIGDKVSGLPSLNLSSPLNALENLELPSSLNEGLDKLNSSIPTFAQVNNFTNNAIRFPFEEVKKLMNESISGFTFNRSVFPVPQKQQLSFCSSDDGINNFFDDLYSLAYLARKIFIGVIIVLAILACIPMAWIEIRRWRKMQSRAQLVNQNAFDPIDVVYLSSRPYTSGFGMKLADRFKSTRRQLLTRWTVAYATSPPALFILSLGVAGLLACLCQAILLKSIEKEVPVLTNKVGSFADEVVNSLNNASAQWALGTNGVIENTNSDINNEVFGWVNTTTNALNDTLNTFVDGMTTVLNTTFGGTVLYDPITEVLNCLITLKIEGIQKGLTWVSDNARIDFPTLPNDTFSLGAAASIASDNPSKADSFLASPDSVTSDQITDAIVRLTNNLANAIHTEALISGTIVLIWCIIVLFGILRALTLFFGRDKTRAEGGVEYPTDLRNDSGGFPSGEASYARSVVPRDPPPRFSYVNPTVEEEYQDAKLGFAGQRNNAAFVNVDAGKSNGHYRQSSYGEMGDEKR